MREIMPTSDLARMSMSKELQMSVNRVPETPRGLPTQAGSWNDIGCHVRTKNSPHRGQGLYGYSCIQG
eukprot:12898616-Prorocentrum_lima.AAC.1